MSKHVFWKARVINICSFQMMGSAEFVFIRLKSEKLYLTENEFILIHQIVTQLTEKTVTK